MKKLFALLLAVLMMVTLTACNKEAADIDDVIDFLEDEEFEYYHLEDSEYLEKGMEEAVSGYHEEKETNLQFIIFEDEDEAKDYFEEMVEEAEDELDPDKTVTKSMGNYDHAEFTGDDMFASISRIGETIMLGTCPEDDADDLKDIFKDFGY